MAVDVLRIFEIVFIKCLYKLMCSLFAVSVLFFFFIEDFLSLILSWKIFVFLDFIFG